MQFAKSRGTRPARSHGRRAPDGRALLAALGLLAAAVALLCAEGAAASGLPPRAPRRPADPLRAAPFAPTLLPSTSGSPVDCVIIAPDGLADVYQPLADYQTRTGIATVVRPLSVIRSADARSNDLAQAIRSFLQDAHQSWGIRWAILAGDADSIPMRYVQVTYGETMDIPTDAYYADLEGTWDANGNGIYGEVADSLDMTPEIAVGRLSASTLLDAQTLVRKTLRYATRPLLPPIGRQVSLAEVLAPPNWQPGQLIQVDGAPQAESLLVRTPGCVVMDRYYENYTQYPGSLPENKASALAALNRGYAVVNHIGHGARDQLSVGSDLLRLTDLDGVANGDSLYLFIASNCASAAVDYDCVAEHVVRDPAGGAFAYIGSTRDAWPGISDELNQAYYDRLFAPGGRSTLGEVVEDARATMLPQARVESFERWGYFETILLGAPTIPVWRCPPDTLVVTRPSTVPLGSPDFSVSVTRGGAPVESALVVVWKGGEDYRAVLTDAAGQAALPFHPATTGGFSLAVSAPDAVPHLDSLLVTGDTPAHFALLDPSVADQFGGDADHVADAGESFALGGTAYNSGGTAAAGPVSVRCEAMTAGLVVDQGLGTLPALAIGATAPLPDSLRLRALAFPNAGRTERVRVILGDGFTADTTEVPVVVAASDLFVAHSVLRDTIPGGNGDGILEPGETVLLRFEIGNEGTGRASGVQIQARNPIPGLTLTDSTAALGAVLADGAAAGLIGFQAGAVVTGRLFDLWIDDAAGHTWVVPIEVDTPAAPTALVSTGSGTDRIDLAWTPPGSPGIEGYRVYRAPDDGSAPVLQTPLPVRRTAVYEDHGLTPLTRYVYAVTAVDSAGNEGPLSATVTAGTTIPEVAGWPQSLGGSTSSSIALGDLDGDGKPELVVGSRYLCAYHSNGTEVRNGDGDSTTIGVFTTALHYLLSSPAVADLDGNGVPEIVAASWDDSLVAVFGADGSMRPGWPQKGGAPFWSTPAIGDIDGDGRPEIVIGSNSSRIYAWHPDGTEVRDGDSNPATNGVFYVPLGSVISSPAIADLKRDGRREVIFGTTAGRVYALHTTPPAIDTLWIFQAPTGSFTSSPAVGDILPGGGLEVAIASSADSVYVLTSSGTVAPGWPRPLALAPANGRVNSPALAPLRKAFGDASLDVIECGASGQIVAWDPSGNVLPGWSNVWMGGPTEASPVVADLDGDGSPEILAGAEDRKLYAFHADGTPVDGFPIETGAEIRGSPAVWDLNGDGKTEIAVAGWDHMLHVWSSPGSFVASGMAWPMWRHDNWRTGLFTFPVLTAVDSLPAAPRVPPPALPALLQNRPNPFNPSTVIRYVVPGPAPEPVTLRVYDVQGRAVATLVSRRVDPGYYDVRWDGRDDHGGSVSSGIYFYRAEIGGRVFTRRMALLK